MATNRDGKFFHDGPNDDHSGYPKWCITEDQKALVRKYWAGELDRSDLIYQLNGLGLLPDDDEWEDPE